MRTHFILVIKIFRVISLTLLIMTSCNYTATNLKFAGIRASSYGISPFPSQNECQFFLNTITSYYKGIQPTAIWIIGVLNSDTGGVDLEFPSLGMTYDKITFRNDDPHESYLNFFDTTQIKVFLQVEPGFADPKTLIDLVLKRFSKHRCVAGFAVDIEWYQNDINGHPGNPVTDNIAAAWEAEVKSFNPSYRLMLKHFNKSYLCPTYRGDIIFVDDSQNFVDIHPFVNELTDFAKYFYPNPIFYQVGYPSDQNWWQKYKNPIKVLGDRLAQKTNQTCGIIWVDFSLRNLISTLNQGNYVKFKNVIHHIYNKKQSSL